MKSNDALAVELLEATRVLATSHHDRPFDVGGITDTIQRALAAAGLNTQSGPMKSVTDTIEQALSSAGLTQRSAVPNRRGTTIDGDAREIDAQHDSADAAAPRPTASEQARRGEFVTRSFTNHAGTRAYKLYVPATYSSALADPVPMVVMLHGCTQSPDDFAAGTQMNALAEKHGFLVVYPAQAANANGSKCWNWFRSEDQIRDRGEPSLIAGITREVESNYRIDERRIFVAGMSAGAAMAVILGVTHPEVYAAVGAHSGLAYGAAHDMPSAFSAMQRTAPVMPDRQAAKATIRPQGSKPVPTIVFHGDCDQTVDVRNGAAIVEQATFGRPDERSVRNEGKAPGGRTFSRTVYTGDAGQPVVEQWVVHGAGHAWSGGNARGSFTDANGPDASAEMIRFFYSQQ